MLLSPDVTWVNLNELKVPGDLSCIIDGIETAAACAAAKLAAG